MCVSGEVVKVEVVVVGGGGSGGGREHTHPHITVCLASLRPTGNHYFRPSPQQQHRLKLHLLSILCTVRSHSYYLVKF